MIEIIAIVAAASALALVAAIEFHHRITYRRDVKRRLKGTHHD